VITGAKVRLELVTEQTLPAYIRLESDLSTRGDHASLELVSEQQLKRQFRETGFWDSRGGRILMFETGSDRIIGSISFSKSIHYFTAFELGFITYLDSDRRKGLMTEAIRLFSTYLFTARNITRLEIRCEPSNEASRKVALSCGYVHEGTNRAVRRKGNDLVDLDLFARTVSDL